MAARVANRTKYRQRIQSLVKNPPSSEGDVASELEIKAHWAKYTCVLISGYIEQAVKEIILEHASATSAPRIRKYIEGTWPNSKNMRCDAIRDILDNLDVTWSTRFDEWLGQDERKKEINEIISWRNDIAHGKETNTNNVTLGSVSTKFKIACELIDFLEGLPLEEAA
ncbi:HEPN domain-containing protein [Sagittula sp.]|uniref:HEPN domain-containing protein n=1 Tax=Sagittula sp. TaxID=2038081 RepID=UPI00405926F2